jgi:hypothetical protein
MEALAGQRDTRTKSIQIKGRWRYHVLLNGSLNHAFGPGHGWSFWQIRVRDTDGKLADALGPKWGGLGKPGAKERALGYLKGLGVA